LEFRCCGKCKNFWSFQQGDTSSLASRCQVCHPLPQTMDQVRQAQQAKYSQQTAHGPQRSMISTEDDFYYPHARRTSFCDENSSGRYVANSSCLERRPAHPKLHLSSGSGRQPVQPMPEQTRNGPLSWFQLRKKFF
jgi:hypothetical protein